VQKTDQRYSHDGLRATTYFGPFHGVSIAAVLMLSRCPAPLSAAGKCEYLFLDLRLGEVGPFTILTQNERPREASNRLPAPAAAFNVTMRLYEARTPVLNGSYRLPRCSKGYRRLIFIDGDGNRLEIANGVASDPPALSAFLRLPPQSSPSPFGQNCQFAFGRFVPSPVIRE
jgi:hypothetical protein